MARQKSKARTKGKQPGKSPAKRIDLADFHTGFEKSIEIVIRAGRAESSDDHPIVLRTGILISELEAERLGNGAASIEDVLYLDLVPAEGAETQKDRWWSDEYKCWVAEAPTVLSIREGGAR
ncbi:MAG: hypothetical protein IT428_32530 [Planctomycetaceae bacterium]|nr:hypothetical protein [Planctomycetaceae bacterium]